MATTGEIILKISKGFVTILNLGFPALLAVTGAFGIKASTTVDDVQVVFVGIYMIVFAATLFCYEVIQLLPCPTLDLLYKKNFGFLYGIYGKGLYTLM